MNTFKNIVTRAAALLAFCGMVAMAHTAHADVIVDDYITPADVTGVASGTIELQVDLYNNNPYSVSGVYVYVTLSIGNSKTTVQSAAVAMTPYESDKWVSIKLPGTAPYLNNTVNAEIKVGSGSFTTSFLDAAPSAVLTMSNITPPANDKTGTAFEVTVTNSGYATSAAKSITGYIWADADGQVSPQYKLTGAVPAIAPGKSTKVTFHLPTITTYNNTGYSDLMGYLTLGTQTLNFEF